MVRVLRGRKIHNENISPEQVPVRQKRNLRSSISEEKPLNKVNTVKNILKDKTNAKTPLGEKNNESQVVEKDLLEVSLKINKSEISQQDEEDVFVENRVFNVSAKPEKFTSKKSSPPVEIAEKIKGPVYQDINPLKRKVETEGEKLHEYDFEIDANEVPGGTKRRKKALKNIKAKEKRNIKKNEELVKKVMRIAHLGEKLKTQTDTPNPAKFFKAIPATDRLALKKNSIPILFEKSPKTPITKKNKKLTTNTSNTPAPPIISEPENIESTAQEIVSRPSEPEVNCSYSTHNSSYTSLPVVGSSTPIKYDLNLTSSFHNQTDPSSFNVSNCFGFDESEDIDEPFVSPIKDQTSFKKPVAIKFIEKKIDSSQIIRQLRFEVEGIENGENEELSTIRSNSSTSDLTTSFEETTEPSLSKEELYKDIVETSELKKPRFSYERPLHLRKKKKVNIHECDDAESEDEIKPKKKKKIIKKPSKKEVVQMEQWAKFINSQFEQVDGFSLAVE